MPLSSTDSPLPKQRSEKDGSVESHSYVIVSEEKDPLDKQLTASDQA